MQDSGGIHNVRQAGLSLGIRPSPRVPSMGWAIYPRAGLYGEHTSHSSSVLKHHSVPFAVLAIYDGSLSSQGKSSKVALQNYF